VITGGLHTFTEKINAEDMADQANPNGRLAQIIAASPAWKFAGGPAEGHTPRIYHATTRGYILNQILIRCDPQGRTIGQWMHEEVCGPIGADFFCGDHDPSYLARPKAGMKFPDFAFVWANAMVADACAKALGIPPDADTAAAAAFMASDKMKLHPNVRTTRKPQLAFIFLADSCDAVCLLSQVDLVGQAGLPRFDDIMAQAGNVMKYQTEGFGPDPATEGPSSSGRANARGMAQVRQV
jgi:hypothetical protein